jgi:hypothetical protein
MTLFALLTMRFQLIMALSYTQKTGDLSLIKTYVRIS